MASTGRGEWGRTAAWAAVFLVAGFLGRATRFDEPPIAFVWPAAGVGILWLVLAPPRRRVVVELPVLAVAAYVVNRVTGAPPTLALVFVFANVVNAWAGALVYLRVSRSPRDQLKDTHGLLALGAGALAGALASAPLSVAVLLTQGQDPAATTAAVWVSRYAASSAVVMAVVLAWRGWSADRRSGAAVGRAPAPAELVALLAVSLLVHGAVFLVNVGESYAFLALPVTVLVGWRAGPAWTATHGLLTASFGVAATLAGRGPFALLEPAALQTVVVQAFIAVTCLVGLALALEVRQRHLALAAAERRGDALERTLDSAVVGQAQVAVGPNGPREVRYANAALRRWWGDGRDGTALAGRSWLDLVAPTDLETCRRILTEVGRDPAGAWEGDLSLLTADGEERSCRVGVARVEVPGSAVGGPAVPLLNLQVVDVTDRAAAEARLAHQVLHDQLTGLPNRLLLVERLEHALAASHRSGGGVALLFVDLDRFKQINDSLGHAAGDEVLQASAQRLAAVVRPTDTVARLGGDEFVVLSPDLDGAEQASHLAERLVDAVSRPTTASGATVQVGASVGVVHAGPGAEPEELLRAADAAMYRAKAAGRGRVELVTAPPVTARSRNRS